MVKKWLSLLLLCTLLLQSMALFPVYGEEAPQIMPPKIIGHLYPTDVSVLMDGVPIPSYRIQLDGKKNPSYQVKDDTVILAEDLETYGFQVIWSQEEQCLEIYTAKLPAQTPAFMPVVPPKKATQAIENVYESKVRTFINGMYIRSYNVGGKTAIFVEELLLANNPEAYAKYYGYRDCFSSFASYGYSGYLFKGKHTAEKKVVHLSALHLETTLETNIGTLPVHHIVYFNLYPIVLLNEYCDMETLLQTLELSYSWNHNIFSLNRPVQNMNLYTYSPISVTASSINDRIIASAFHCNNGLKVRCYLLGNGKVLVNIKDFARLTGYALEYDGSQYFLYDKGPRDPYALHFASHHHPLSKAPHAFPSL